MPSLTPERDRRFVVALALITAVGLAWRIAYVLWIRDVQVLSDGIHYHLGANYLADGRGWVNPLSLAFSGQEVPDAVHPPGWESVLAVASFLGVRTYLGHQLVACLVAGTIVMTGLAGREAFGRRVGLIAAAVAAVYANLWLYERELLSEPARCSGSPPSSGWPTASVIGRAWAGPSRSASCSGCWPSPGRR